MLENSQRAAFHAKRARRDVRGGTEEARREAQTEVYALLQKPLSADEQAPHSVQPALQAIRSRCGVFGE